MHRMRSLIFIVAVALAACNTGGSFSGWQTEDFAKTRVTESTSKTFVLANSFSDKNQHIRAIAFDRGSNAAGHFRIDKLEVSGQQVSSSDIVIRPAVRSPSP